MGKKKDNVVEDTKHIYAEIDGEEHTVRYIDVEVGEVKKEFSLDNMIPYVDRNTAEMLLVPYVRKPEQEYADKHKCYDHGGVSEWEQHAVWTDYPPPTHSEWTQYSNITSDECKYGGKLVSLSDLIKIREDAEDYGFVYNKETNVVFLANKQTIDFLRSHMYNPLMEFQQEYPQIYSKLLMAENKS